MPLTNDRTALFIHIPKCAGTSLEIAMGYNRRYPTLGESRTVTTSNYDDLFGGGLQHLSIRETAENYPHCLSRVKLRFAVIRHPVERIISAYGWKTYRFNRASVPSPKVLAKDFEDWFDEILPLLENNLILDWPYDGMLSAEHAFDTPRVDEGGKRHFMPQIGFVYNRGKIDLDLLINFDSISETRSILKRFGVNIEAIPHRMKSVNATEVEKNISEKYRKRITELYRHDVELYESLKDRAYLLATRTGLHVVPKTRSLCSARESGTNNQVPKILFMYWHQGWKNAPEIVKRCAATWQRHNPTWDIFFLDSASVAEKVKLPPAVKNLNLPLPALSDVIRICLLKEYGGVWADATLWCTRPLDDWIEVVCNPSGFFAYEKPGPGRPISSWFLAAGKECPIVDCWYSAVCDLLAKTVADSQQAPDPERQVSSWFPTAVRECRVADFWLSTIRRVLTKTLVYAQHVKWIETRQKSWLVYGFSSRYKYYFFSRLKNLVASSWLAVGSRLYENYFLSHMKNGNLLLPTSENLRRGDYFWFHYLFGRLLEQNDEFHQLWTSTPKISADGPHFLQLAGLLKPATARTDFIVINKFLNMHKLTHRVSVPDDASGTILGSLYRSG